MVSCRDQIISDNFINQETSQLSALLHVRKTKWFCLARQGEPGKAGITKVPFFPPNRGEALSRPLALSHDSELWQRQ